MSEEIEVVFDEDSVLIEDPTASVSFVLDCDKLSYTNWFRFDNIWMCFEKEGDIVVTYHGEDYNQNSENPN